MLATPKLTHPPPSCMAIRHSLAPAPTSDRPQPGRARRKTGSKKSDSRAEKRRRAGRSPVAKATERVVDGGEYHLRCPAHWPSALFHVRRQDLLDLRLGHFGWCLAAARDPRASCPHCAGKRKRLLCLGCAWHDKGPHSSTQCVSCRPPLFPFPAPRRALLSASWPPESVPFGQTRGHTHHATRPVQSARCIRMWATRRRASRVAAKVLTCTRPSAARPSRDVSREQHKHAAPAPSDRWRERDRSDHGMGVRMGVSSTRATRAGQPRRPKGDPRRELTIPSCCLASSLFPVLLTCQATPRRSCRSVRRLSSSVVAVSRAP